MSSVQLVNKSSQELSVLVQDSAGGSQRYEMDPDKTLSCPVAPGEVFVKLFKPGQTSARAFGMRLASADLTTKTVNSGDTVEIVDGASWAEIRK